MKGGEIRNNLCCHLDDVTLLQRFMAKISQNTILYIVIKCLHGKKKSVYAYVVYSILYCITFFICKKGNLVQHSSSSIDKEWGVGEGFFQLCFSNSWQEYIKIMSIYTSEGT